MSDGTFNWLQSADSLYAAKPVRNDEWNYVVRINPNLTIAQPTRPNAWFRFWQRVLLGWTWESK